MKIDILLSCETVSCETVSCETVSCETVSCENLLSALATFAALAGRRAALNKPEFSLLG